MQRSVFVPVLLALGPALAAQSNQDPGIDVNLAQITNINALGRTGTFPNGLNGVAITTTACNEGTKQVNWQAAMDPDHPFIAFLLARERDGRFEQISDWSYVKHGFFALSSEFCSDCTPTDGTVLGLGCSDTYDTNTNGDSFWLGPPDEIDPWRGLWDPVCSHFDRGEPPVASPNDCNGQRSLNSTMVNNLGPVAHRIRVKDADLNGGGSFWFQGQYVIETEGDRVRGNNIASRAFTASWTGNTWNLTETGAMTHGSVLTRWVGASVSSATNGIDDGRLYVAVKVTGPNQGVYHYEFAVHDRDNGRGVGALHIPVCPGARVLNLGFGDIDDDAGNDWSASVAGGEIVFSTASSPLRWNTIYNFWFDSDAAPAAGFATLDQFEAGPGLPSVGVPISAPTLLANVFLGSGCALDTPPTLYGTGTPPRATLGNASFALQSSGNDPSQPNILRFGLLPGSQTLGGCTLFLGGTLSDTFHASTVLSNASGVATHPAGIPNDLAFEGLDIRMQAIGRDPGNGPLFGGFELSDALLVRVGSSLSDCP